MKFRKLLRKQIILSFSFSLVLVAGVLWSSALWNWLEVRSNLLESQERLGPLSWKAVGLIQEPGDYFISLGRPRGSCDFYLNDELVSTTKSSSGTLRRNFQLFSDLTVKAPPFQVSIDVKCLQEEGFSVALTHRPFLQKAQIGKAIHYIRVWKELYFGPIAAVIILLLLVLLRSNSRISSRLSGFNHEYFILFGFATLSYTLSLAHWPRLFVDPWIASWLHVLLKSFYVLSLSLVFSVYAGTRKFVSWLIVVPFCYFFVRTAMDPIGLDTYYLHIYYLYPLPFVLATWFLFRTPASTAAQSHLRTIALLATLFQTIDVFRIVVDFGSYSAPILTSLIGLSLVVIKIHEDRTETRLLEATDHLLSVSQSKQPIGKVVTQIGQVLHGMTHFKRVSVYLDGKITGSSSKPFSMSERIYEHGYIKETAQDRFLEREGRKGTRMFLDRPLEEVELKYGEADTAGYVIVRLANLAYVNLSDREAQIGLAPYDSLNNVRRLVPALKPLLGRLAMELKHIPPVVEFLTANLSPGTHVMNCVVICADIAAFEKHQRQVGFDTFLHQQYLPVLFRQLKHVFVGENFDGDKIKLYSFDLMHKSSGSASRASHLTTCLTALSDFVHEEGKQLCLQHGFEPIRFRVGVSYGSTTVLFNGQIPTYTGVPLINAARLEPPAQPDTFLVQQDGVNFEDLSENFIVSEPRPIRAKRGFIYARTLIRKEANAQKIA